MRSMSNSEYLISHKEQKFTGSGKLGLRYRVRVILSLLDPFYNLKVPFRVANVVQVVMSKYGIH